MLNSDSITLRRAASPATLEVKSVSMNSIVLESSLKTDDLGAWLFSTVFL